MATLLSLDPSRRRRAIAPLSAKERRAGPANVLLFTGVRREPLAPDLQAKATEQKTAAPDGPAPVKPGSKKRQRR